MSFKISPWMRRRLTVTASLHAALAQSCVFAHSCAQEAEGMSFKMKSVDEKKADYDHANKEVSARLCLVAQASALS